MAETFAEAVGASEATPVITSTPAPAAPNDYVELKKSNFHFKRDVAKDEAGNVIKDPDTGKPKAGSNHPEGKHPTAEMYLPIPKTSRLIEFLSDPTKYAKEVDLIRTAVEDVIYTVARSQVNDFREKDLNALVHNGILNYDDLDWTKIANTPKSERGAYAPSEEELKTFYESYMEVMPTAAQKPEANIKNHILLFQGGFKKQRAQKEVLELMKGMLDTYLNNAGEAAVEDNFQVVDYFITKLSRWMAAEAPITMSML